MRRLVLCLAIFAILVGGLGQTEVALAVKANQSDDFSDGTTKGWTSGNRNPNPLRNIQSDGPGGDDDNFLQITSTRVAEGAQGSEAGVGGKSLALNRTRWAGDYIFEDITAISAHLKYLSGEPEALYMRVAFRGANDTWFASIQSILLTEEMGWQVVVFPIEEGNLTRTSGQDRYADVMTNVKEFRILSRASTPGHQGDEIFATFGIDNLTAGDTPLTEVITAVTARGNRLTILGKIKMKR